MYQALQNTVWGSGAISGASIGGLIADTIGWRWCFLLQVPISVAGFIFGWFMICDQQRLDDSDGRFKGMWKKIDFAGALVLVTGLSTQLVGLSLGGNVLPWGNQWVIGSLVVSCILLAAFVLVESKTTAIPIIPLRMLSGRLSISVQLTNLFAGLAAYAVSPTENVILQHADSLQYLFMLPLFFQVVLLDSVSQAGARLAIPSLATPIGGLVAGIIMSRYGKLIPLFRLGVSLMTLGNGLVTSLGFHDATWKYFVFIVPANLGQGITYPSTLFTNIATFEHSGKFQKAVKSNVIHVHHSQIMPSPRPRCT